MKYLTYIINGLLIILIPTIIYKTPISNQKQTIEIDSSIKKLKSEIIKVEPKTEKSEDNENEKLIEEIKTDTNTVITNKIEEKKIIEEEKVDTTNNNITPIESTEIEKEDILETQIGKMSGYGPNCIGCSGYLASGKYVGDGNVYYNDNKYGLVRIVAGDYKYKLGSIVRIKNSKVSNEPILAIVLDRGGSIGIDKKYMFDLLFTSEEEAAKYEVSYNVTFEILRNGY